MLDSQIQYHTRCLDHVHFLDWETHPKCSSFHTSKMNDIPVVPVGVHSCLPVGLLKGPGPCTRLHAYSTNWAFKNSQIIWLALPSTDWTMQSDWWKILWTYSFPSIHQVDFWKWNEFDTEPLSWLRVLTTLPIYSDKLDKTESDGHTLSQTQ